MIQRLFAGAAAYFWAAALISALVAGQAAAHEFRNDSLLIDHPWSRKVTVNAPTAVGYMTIKNTGKSADRLIAAETPYARSVEIHEVTVTDNVMRMRPVANGIAIRPGATISLSSKGFHLMILGPGEEFAHDGRIPLTLVFEKAGRIDVEIAVEPARTIEPEHSGH